MWLLARLWNLFRSKVPGPRIAKLTSLWKLYHLRKGDYVHRLAKLHLKHGNIVQVGPFDYHVSDPSLCDRRARLQNQDVENPKLSVLNATLTMSNIFRYEPIIDECNQALLTALSEYLQTGEEIKVADLVSRYAFDTLFATMTGVRPGFLTTLDIDKLLDAMKNWKFHATVYGSYMRFHPIIAKFVTLFKRKTFERQVSQYISAGMDKGEGRASIMNEIQQQLPPRSDPFEACVALVLAGSDPAITHILSSLYYIYRDPELVDGLRQEIANANLGNTPTIKELIYSKLKMPLLHAVLQESLRLHQPHTSGINLVSPKGGTVIGDKRIPQGCTICVEPQIAHVNVSIFGEDASEFNPTRWLGDPALARRFRNHMVAFGAGATTCPGSQLHIAIVSKLLCQIIAKFDMYPTNKHTTPVNMTIDEIKACFAAHIKLPDVIHIVYKDDKPSEAAGSSPTLSTATTVTPDNAHPLDFDDVSVLDHLLGLKVATEIIDRFEKDKHNLTPRPLLKTNPIYSSHERYLTHKVIERVFEGKLNHHTDNRSKSMYLWVPGSKIPDWLTKSHANFIKDQKKQNAGPKASPPPTTTNTAKPKSNAKVAWNDRPERKGVKSFDTKWVDFLTGEHERVTDLYAMSGEEYQREKAKAEAEPNKAPVNKAFTMTAKEKFKQTYKPVESETDAITTAKATVVPPHLRNKLTA